MYLETAARLIAIAMAAAIPLSVVVTNVLAVALLLCCILSIDKQKFWILIKHPVSVAVLIFVGLYLCRSVYSAGNAAEIKLALRKYSRLLYIPLLMPLFTGFNWRRYILIAYMLAIFITVVVSLYFGQLIFKDSIFTSLFVAYAIYILGHYSLNYAAHRWLAILLAIFFTYFLLFVSIGRTGQVLFFVLYLLLCWQKFGARIKSQLLAITVLALIVAASLFLPSSFAERQVLAVQQVQGYLADTTAPVLESSMGSRLAFARHAIEIIKLKPIFGWGSGSFIQAFLKVFPNSKQDQVFTVNPHNQYLLVGVELGLVGIVSLLYLFFTLGITFYRSKQLDSQLGVGLVIAIALGCVVNSWLLDFATMFFFALFAGVLLGSASYSKR